MNQAASTWVVDAAGFLTITIVLPPRRNGEPHTVAAQRICNAANYLNLGAFDPDLPPWREPREPEPEQHHAIDAPMPPHFEDLIPAYREHGVSPAVAQALQRDVPGFGACEGCDDE